MDLNACILLIQSYLDKSPLIILGSGSSATYGLPTMTDLRDEILKHKTSFDQNDEVVKSFFHDIDLGYDLETAIGMEHQLSQNEKNLIRSIVWQKVNSDDIAFFEREMQNDFTNFDLVSLFKKAISPTPNRIDIITTNYDRLAEYAADIIGASIITGFEGAYYKKMEFPTSNLFSKRIKSRERIASIWKVHGFLDWFLSPSGTQCALPSRSNIPNGFFPNIIPPGNEKYHDTHLDPYRTIITQADASITNAQCYLAIGYGFNDDHIQPKVIEEIKKGKAIVVITKKASKACISELTQSGVPKYMIIEEENSKTHVISNISNDYFDDDFWSLKGFLKKW